MGIKNPQVAADLFAALGFESQATTFDRIFADPTFRQLIEGAVGTSDLARILRFFPDLYVIHTRIEPASGSFFVRLFEKDILLSMDEVGCYTKFYPEKLLLILERDGVLTAQWFRKFLWTGGKPTGKLAPFNEILRAIDVPKGAIQKDKIAALGLTL